MEVQKKLPAFPSHLSLHESPSVHALPPYKTMALALTRVNQYGRDQERPHFNLIKSMHLSEFIDMPKHTAVSNDPINLNPKRLQNNNHRMCPKVFFYEIEPFAYLSNMTGYEDFA